ncbi:hypothetical protein ACQ4PT_005643 [Festuca glaucescens]
MDANWRPTQGSGPASAGGGGGGGVDPNAPAEGDWRSQLQPEARSMIVNKIMVTLKKHLPVSVPEGLNELQKIAERFEERIYNEATDQSIYLRKISLKMLSMETKTQQAPGNAQVIPNQTTLVKSDYLRKISLKMLSMETKTQQAPGNAEVIPNQNNPGQAHVVHFDKLAFYAASLDNTAQTGHTAVGDWQEEIYQMIKSLKDQYFAELSELFNKLSVKLQHVDSIIPPPQPSEQNERMKSFKIMLERILQILEISKSNIQPALRDKVPQYEKQIISILNSQRREPVQAQVQQQFLQVQMNPYKDSAAQTGHAGAGDWQEEIYQMIKRLKDQYFVELNELFNKVSVKLQQVDSLIPPQELSEQYALMKSFKIMLDRILQVLQISKSAIQPSIRHKVLQYEKQIIRILTSQRRKPVQPQRFQPPAGQASNFNISQQQQPSQSLSQHDSHTNPQASLSSMSTGLQSSSAAVFRHVPVPPTTNFCVPAQQNDANIQRQAGYAVEAAQGSNFSSWQSGSMGAALRQGSTGPMQGTMNVQLQAGSSSMLSHLSGQREHMTKRKWRDTL